MPLGRVLLAHPAPPFDAVGELVGRLVDGGVAVGGLGALVAAVAVVRVLVGEMADGVAEFVGPDQGGAVVVGGHGGDAVVAHVVLDAAVARAAVHRGVREDEDDVGGRGPRGVRADLVDVDAQQPLDVTAPEVRGQRRVPYDALGGVAGHPGLLGDGVHDPDVEQVAVALVRLDLEDGLDLGPGVGLEVPCWSAV